MKRRIVSVVLALFVVAQVPAAICEVCMKKCTTHKAGDTYNEPYGTNTFTYTVTKVSDARKCGGFSPFSYCSGDAQTVVCETRTQYTRDANGNLSGPYPNNLSVNPCH